MFASWVRVYFHLLSTAKTLHNNNSIFIKINNKVILKNYSYEFNKQKTKSLKLPSLPEDLLMNCVNWLFMSHSDYVNSKYWLKVEIIPFLIEQFTTYFTQTWIFDSFPGRIWDGGMFWISLFLLVYFVLKNKLYKHMVISLE